MCRRSILMAHSGEELWGWWRVGHRGPNAAWCGLKEGMTIHRAKKQSAISSKYHMSKC